MEPTKLKALVSLLEDEEIADVIETEILSVGTPAISYLEELATSDHPPLQRRIGSLTQKLYFSRTKQLLASWHASAQQDVLEGLWIVATYAYPHLTLEELQHQITQLEYQVWLHFKNDAHPFDQVNTMNDVFFHKLRFSGNAKFYDADNSYINRTLTTRKGNPISLCALYWLVAKKTQMPLYLSSVPRMFMLLYKSEKHEFYVNVFNKGLIFTKGDIEKYIQDAHLLATPDFLGKAENAEVIRRSLRNLMVAYDLSKEYDKAENIKELLLAISDGRDVIEHLS